MTIARPLTEMRDQMDRLFSEIEEFQFPTTLGDFRERAFTRTLLPPVDLVETDNSYDLKVEIPGIKPENLDVQVLGDSVVIRGQTREEVTESKKDYHRRERQFGSIFRRIPLPGEVKTEGVKAELKQGVLELILPKANNEKARRIQVQAK
jgi:HSP20 family protein